MDLGNLGEKLLNGISKTMGKNKNIEADNGINENEIELAQKLGAIEEFTIDRIEDNIAVLENRETKEIVNVDISKLPQNINEGEILNKINGKYILDKDKTEEVSNRIKNKMNNLWE